MGLAAQRRTGKRRTLLVACLVLLPVLVSLSLHAQEEVPLNVEPNPVGVNDRFTISFVVETPRAESVSVGEWEYPAGVRLYAGPYIRGIVLEDENGAIRPAVAVSYILLSNRSGRILFPSIPFSDGSRVLSTARTIVRVGSYRSGELYLPLEVEWQIPEGPFFEGQTIPAVLLLRNQEEILLPDRVSVTASKGGFFEEAPELGTIQSSSYGGTVLYTVPVTGYLFTPTGQGRFFLNKAEVSAQGMSGVSAALALDVQPLPESVALTGAVGNFRISATLSAGEVRAGEEVELRIRVEGEGNLGYLTIPEPELTALTVLRSDESHAYLPSGGGGYNGFREVLYVLQAEEEGLYSLKIPPFPQFDPSSRRVNTGRAQELALSVRPGGEELEAEERYRPDTLLFSAEELEAGQAAQLTGRWQIYLFFAPGPLIFLFIRLRRRFRSSAGAVLLLPLTLLLLSAGDGFAALGTQANSHFQGGEYEAAAAGYASLLAEHPHNGRLLYNYSLALEENGERGRAVLALLAAHRRLGSQERLQLSWDELSRRGDYIRQYDLPRFFPPEFSFILLLFFYNLFFLFFSLASLKLRSFLLLSSLLFGTLTLASGGLFAHAQLLRRERVAVIAEDLVTRRIPRQIAQDWITLPEGLAVRVTMSSGDFRLVETAYGAEGWVDKGDILTEDDLLPGEVRQ